MDNNRQIALRMKNESYQSLIEIAIADKRSVSSLIRIILEEYIEKKGDKS